MQSTAMLEIRQALGGPYASEQEAMQANGGVLPANAVLMKGRNIGVRGQGQDNGEQYWLISRASAVSGSDLRGAEAGRDENGRPDVKFTLTGEGGRRFAAFTGAHVGEQLAVVLDNKVMEVATIQEQIHDRGPHHRVVHRAADAGPVADAAFGRAAGRHQVPGRAHGWSVAGRRFDPRRRAGCDCSAWSPSWSSCCSTTRFAGINADLGLFLNLVILLGFLGFSSATLTLPGIAGVILTIGMGVDSNVLIFERIREELRHGKTPPSAVEQGFAHAWITIVDTHVTTIVSAIILFLFGTGPVRGFAVTLSFGLLANLFTSVFVSRVIFDSILNRHQRGEALSI